MYVYNKKEGKHLFLPVIKKKVVCTFISRSYLLPARYVIMKKEGGLARGKQIF